MASARNVIKRILSQTRYGKVPSTAKLRIWTLRIWGFQGPGFHSARQVFCGDASRLFLDHFSKHLSSVLGRTELCHEVRNPGPQNPKSSTIKTTTWHCSEVTEGMGCSATRGCDALQERGSPQEGSLLQGALNGDKPKGANRASLLILAHSLRIYPYPMVWPF